MTKRIRAFYKTGLGLSGCYLDDSQGCAMEFNRRKDLADAIRSEIEYAGFPAHCFEQVSIRRLWSLITNAGSASSFTFYIEHKGQRLTFYGLTEREYLEDLAAHGDAEDRAALEAYDNA